MEISYKRVLTAAFLTASLTAGCDSSSGPDFTGRYAGVGTNPSAYYALEAEIADDGTITGQLYVYDGLTAPPSDVDFPDNSYGEVLEFEGLAYENEASATTIDGTLTLTGSFDESGLFTGTIEETDLEDPAYTFVAAVPVADADDLAVACGEYSMYEEIATTPPPPADEGDSLLLTNGEDVFGILTSFEGDLTGTFSGNADLDLCPSEGPCGSFDAEFDGTFNGEPLALDLTEGGIERNEIPDDYTYLYFNAGLENADYFGFMSGNTDNCYSYAWTPPIP